MQRVGKFIKMPGQHDTRVVLPGDKAALMFYFVRELVPPLNAVLPRGPVFRRLIAWARNHGVTSRDTLIASSGAQDSFASSLGLKTRQASPIWIQATSEHASCKADPSNSDR
jgi:hypothetical protein